ncbi:MAG: aldo/keto reductase [Acidimicrobiales bacterium]
MTLPTRRIGTLEVTTVGIGCNNFGGRIGEAATSAVVDAAIEAGINFFDTADIYGATKSEMLLGVALGARRADVLIATKFGMPIDAEHKGARPQYVRQALDDSLRRLGTDWIDLYQLHEPDPQTPVADTLGVLDELVQAGKIREIGCSNFSSEQLDEAAKAATGANFVSVQNEYSIFHRQPEHDVLERAGTLGMAFLPYFPLARGLLTGKYRPGQAPPAGSRLASMDAAQYEKYASAALAAVARLEEIAAAHRRTLVELAVAWLLSRSVVASVIAGATRPEQVHANAKAADWQLDRTTLDAVDDIVAPGQDWV